jgi:phenylacetate-CoA ligase
MPCRSCGRTNLRFQIMGRKSDQLQVRGRSILPRDIRHIVKDNAETTAGLFQIIKSSAEMDTLALRVGYDPAVTTSPDEIIRKLQAKIATALGVPVTIELTLNAELLKLGPPHKIPRVTKQ